MHFLPPSSKTQRSTEEQLSSHSEYPNIRVASHHLWLKRLAVCLLHSVPQLRSVCSIQAGEKQFPCKKSDNIIKTLSLQLDSGFPFIKSSRMTFKVRMDI